MDGFIAWFNAYVEWTIQQVTRFADWIMELIWWGPRMMWKDTLDALGGFVTDFPVPDFLANAGSFFGGIPSTVVYFFDFFAIPEGFAMITSALLLRFALRRVPLIG